MKHHALLDGPCLMCRQRMNWIAFDTTCWQICRWCLGYLLEALKWAPDYGMRLVHLTCVNAYRRGERISTFYMPRAAVR